MLAMAVCGSLPCWLVASRFRTTETVYGPVELRRRSKAAETEPNMEKFQAEPIRLPTQYPERKQSMYTL
jgi:hypothetical protein